MDYSPHTLHQILTRIREQARCPQCGTPVDIDLSSVKVMSDDFMLIQIKCQSCAAFIVLHVNIPPAIRATSATNGIRNASSTIAVSEEEMQTLLSP